MLWQLFALSSIAVFAQRKWINTASWKTCLLRENSSMMTSARSDALATLFALSSIAVFAQRKWINTASWKTCLLRENSSMMTSIGRHVLKY